MVFLPLFTAGDNKAPMVAAEEEDDEVPGQHTDSFFLLTLCNINRNKSLSVLIYETYEVFIRDFY